MHINSRAEAYAPAVFDRTRVRPYRDRKIKYFIYNVTCDTAIIKNDKEYYADKLTTQEKKGPAGSFPLDHLSDF